MSPTATPDPLTSLLETHDVRRAVVIDDLFDRKVSDYIKPEAMATFAAELSAKPNMAAELVAAQIEKAEILARNETALRALAQQRDRLLITRPAIETLLFDYLAELGNVDELILHLQAINIEVTPLGADVEIPANLTAQLAFIDYFLDGDPPAPSANEDAAQARKTRLSLGKRAREKAQIIYKQTRAHIVLMSNRSDVATLESEFRSEAKLLKGYFRFQEKETLSDRNKLRALLTMLPLTADFRHVLHDFIDCLQTRTQALIGRFMEEIRTLGLEDYAHLRQLSLNHEGHPFGDYTIKLFGAFLTSLVLEDATIATEVDRLDATQFESLLPIVSDPSTTLGRVYLASLTERLRRPIEHTAEVPATSDTSVVATEQDAQNPEAPQEALIQLELGDLFVRNVASPVYAVMNPACDLPVAPGRGREGDDTILLLPGQLRLLHELPAGTRPPTLFTPMYLHEGHIYRIDWDYRKLRTLPHREIPALLAEGYKCERRLHLGPALELQQHFTAETGRVGLPVAPPLGRTSECTVYCRDAEGKWAPLTTVVTAGAAVFHMRDKDQFVIPDPAKERILDLIEAHAAVLRDATTTWANRGHYVTAIRQAATRWRTNCPFHRAFGTLPGGRTSAKSRSNKICEAKDKLGVVVGTAFLTAEKVDAEVVLSLNLGPMPFGDDAEMPREMDELQ